MSTADLNSRLQPWLARWSLEDLADDEPWLAGMQLCSFPAESYLVLAGDQSDNLFLLDNGLVRLYYASPEGRERNKAFFREGQVTGPVSAAISGSPAPFSIQCLEPVEAISFRYRDLVLAAERQPRVARLYRDMLAEAFIRNEQREAMLLTCNAEQRYQWLLDNEAYLLERVPQFHLASYLGIDAVSLSRLKRKNREQSGQAH